MLRVGRVAGSCGRTALLVDRQLIRPLSTFSVYLFDTETTGMSPGTDGIVEIGIRQASTWQAPGSVCAQLSMLVDPEMPIANSFIHGITDEMVRADGCHVDEAWRKVMEFVAETQSPGATPMLIAHNAKFDVGMLRGVIDTDLMQSCSNWKVACSYRHMALKLLPQLRSHSLANLCREFGIVHEGAHRAMNDLNSLDLVINAIIGSKHSPAFIVKELAAQSMSFPPPPKPHRLPPTLTPPPLEGPIDYKIFNGIHTWRSTTSKVLGTAPFIVMPNATVVAIARAQPRSIDELLEVSGIGPHRAEKYGDDIIKLIHTIRPT